MSDNFDKNLRKIFQENKQKDIPTNTKSMIKETLGNIEEKRKYKNRLIYKITSISAVFMLICGVVFGKDLIKIINNMFNYDFNRNQGIQVAVNNGYIQNVNMEYIESNNIKFKIDYITMDDSILALNFNFLLDEDAENFKGISFYDMKIYDDNNNIIYTDAEKFPNEGISLGGGIVKTIFIQGNNIVQSFLIESDRFPKTKTIRVTIKKIILYDENNGSSKSKIISGDFDITVKLDEKFYNRNTKTYDIITKSDKENIKLSKVFLTETSFNFIIDNIEQNDLCIELKDENGKILYYDEKIYLRKINDDTGRKITKIDITKYENISDTLEVVIKAKKNEEIINDVYLDNYETIDNTIYNIEEIEKNMKDVEENEYFTIANYVLYLDK